jgi:glycerophosphoryl diester phosphodiesterase
MLPMQNFYCRWFIALSCTLLLTLPSGRGYASTDKTIVVHGHRGSRGTHPENTLAAFEEALRAGAQVLELDLQLNRDGVIVVSHDAVITSHLCKNADGSPLDTTLAIHDLSLPQIASFDCGSIKNPRFPDQQPVPGSHIPTLESVIAWAKKNASNVEFNMETKMEAPKKEWVADPGVFAKKVVELLRKHGMTHKTILQSFDFRTLREAKKLEPQLRLSFLFESKADFCGIASQGGGQFISPYFDLLSENDVKNCHAKAVKVAPWTLNTEKEWKRAIAIGVDGIITDYPRRLISFLSAAVKT